LAHELAKLNHRVIFYGDKEQREIIEKTGAEFRLYAHATVETLDIKVFFNDKKYRKNRDNGFPHTKI
jgi:UDP:flavonoid glycosyltransferase YjiC (YdhE family)